MTQKDIPVYNIDHLSHFKRDDLLISRFAPYLGDHKNLHTAHKHSFYHLILFTEGSGNHSIDFHEFRVQPYQIYFMIPGQVHAWNFQGHVDGYVINFSVPFFQSFLNDPEYFEKFSFFSGSIPDSVIDLPLEVHEVIKECFERLIGESTSIKPYGLDMIKAIMLQLFFTVARVNHSQRSVRPGSHNYQLLRRFQSLIETHYATMRLPKDYAMLLHITPNHLNALCKELRGVPAGELIRNRITLEAKRLLVNHELGIAEIAYKLQFNDNSYFSKFFRKQTGFSPEQFRSNASKQLETETALR